MTRAMSIASYEDGGLERVFLLLPILPDWRPECASMSVLGKDLLVPLIVSSRHPEY